MYSYLSIDVSRVSVQPEVVMFPPEAVVLKDIQHSGHLAEDEHSRALLFQLREKLVQHTHLTTVVDKVSVRREGRTWGVCVFVCVSGG